jgi:hypothetical protein
VRNETGPREPGFEVLIFNFFSFMSCNQDQPRPGAVKPGLDLVFFFF